MTYNGASYAYATDMLATVHVWNYLDVHGGHIVAARTNGYTWSVGNNQYGYSPHTFVETSGYNHHPLVCAGTWHTCTANENEVVCYGKNGIHGSLGSADTALVGYTPHHGRLQHLDPYGDLGVYTQRVCRSYQRNCVLGMEWVFYNVAAS